MADAPTMTITATYARDTDLYCAIIGAGASGSDAITYVAIALAESGGNLAAISPLASDGSRGYGAWQIEYPTHSGLFPNGLGSGTWIYPSVNAQMAVQVKAAQGFGAWTTYKTKAYAAFTARALESYAAAAAEATAHQMTMAAFVAATNKANEVNLTPLVGTVALAGGLGAAADATGNALGSVGGAFAGLYQGYSGPESGNPLLRMVEIFLGAVLLVAGLKALTAPAIAPLGSAVKSAAKLAI